MNPIEIFKDSLKVSLRTWRLWVLGICAYGVALPAGVLGLVFGLGISAKQNPEMVHSVSWMQFLATMPVGGWILAFVLMVVLMLPLQYVNFIFQAAMMRMVVDVEEGRPASMRQSLTLGSKRWVGIAQLMLTLGALIVLISCLPLLVGVLSAQVSPMGVLTMQVVQLIGLPFTLVLSILLLVLLLVVAIEELPLRDAFRRAGTILRTAWWCVLLAYVVLMALSFGIALLAVPVLMIGFFLVFLSSAAAPWVLLILCIVVSPIGLALMALLMAFWIAMLTTIYRAAQKEILLSAESKAA
jgi:hypothetical protein